MLSFPFAKLQALGNDFVLIDALQRPFALTTDLVRRLSDRHFGIGCDQLLLIEPPTRSGCDVQYRIFNADGSEVAQCGNGARCVGRYLWEAKIFDRDILALGTASRTLWVRREADSQVSVNMGLPLFEFADIPLVIPSHSVLTHTQGITIEFEKQPVVLHCVNIGNPHAVIEVTQVAVAPVNGLGEWLQTLPVFPDKVNVEFVEYQDIHRIQLRVFERGVGETLACGSGACAAAVVGLKLGKVRNPIQVQLPGGILEISWMGSGQPVWMKGGAEWVFRGEWQ